MSAARQQKRLMAADSRGKVKGRDPRVDSPEVMQRIIREVLLDEPRVGIPAGAPPPKDLLAEPKVKVAYDLRAGMFRYSVRGVVSKMGQRQFRGMVYETLRSHAATLSEIFGGTWKPVGGRIEWGTRMRTQAQPTGVDEEALGQAAFDPTTGKYSDAPQRVVHVPMEEQDVVLRVAFAELTQKPIICPLYEQRQNRSGARFGYAESGGLVKRMGSRDLEQRDNARELIEFTNSAEDPVSADLPADVKKRAKKFLMDFNMTAEEAAGALGVNVAPIRDFHAGLLSKKEAEPNAGE